MHSLALSAALLFAVDFQKEVAPVFEQACLACHGATQSAAGLRLDTAAGAMRVVRPGQPDSSPLYTRTQVPPGKTGSMPPGGPALTAAQSAALRNWIAEGANWPSGFIISPRKSNKAPDDQELARKLH